MAASAATASVYGSALDAVDYLNVQTNISVGPCATVDHFWASMNLQDPNGLKEARIYNLKEKFHQGRQIQLRHLPRDVAEEEVKTLMRNNGFQCRQIHIIPGSGMARVSLIDPDPSVWEIWASLHHHSGASWVIRGHRVSAVPTHTQDLLCVARISPDLTDQEFDTLVGAYGQVRRSFIMYSEETGESMGYGFVEYGHKESALHAKASIDGMAYRGATLVCDWLDPSIITLSGLHSKLLYVDKLPKDYRDMAEFRRYFSQVASPPYCQIALRGGAPQDWGLVEFSDHVDAETTMRQMNNRVLHGTQIRVSFYIPGVRAINIYMRLLNETCQNKGKDALLPEPPANTISQQLLNLSKQNPAFVQSLQNIIATQIQTLQQKEAAKGPIQNTQHRIIPSQNPVTSVAPGFGMMLPMGNGLPNVTVAPPTSLPTSSPPQSIRSHSTQNIAGLRTMQPPLPSEPQSSTIPTSMMSLPPPLISTKPSLPPGINTVTTASNGLSSLINGLRPAPSVQTSISNSQITGLLGALSQTQTLDPNTAGLIFGMLSQSQESQTNTLINLLIQALQSALGQKAQSVPLSQPVMPSNPMMTLPRMQEQPTPAQIMNLWNMGLFQTPNAAVMHTPPGSKRKFSHLLPSPEQSPENGYIGQHSQGLGGHYADSYLKRLRKN